MSKNEGHGRTNAAAPTGAPPKRSPGRIADFGLGRGIVAGKIEMNSTVPCGACNACCRNPHLVADLTPEEVKDYPDAVEVDGEWRLPKRPNGECVHLTDGRCSIYDRRPVSCRSYDCRRYLVGYPRGSSDQIGHVREVFDMWDAWEVDTPEDVDHMFAWHRGAQDTFASAPKTATDITLRLSSLFRRYVGESHEFRDAVGYETARDVALAQDEMVRDALLYRQERTVWAKERLTGLAFGNAVNAVASRIADALGLPEQALQW